MDITALASLPISEDSPAGSDAKYEPEYEALSEEIAKLSSVNVSSPISWQAVAENGEAILAHKSKDIAVAAYIAAALLHIDGAQGFIEGANLLCGLCENFWEDAFPPKAKIRRRLNAYEWWHERALNLLKKEWQAPISSQLSAEMTEAAKKLDNTVASLMEDAPPLHDIIEAIRTIPLLPETMPETKPETVPTPAQDPKPAASSEPRQNAQEQKPAQVRQAPSAISSEPKDAAEAQSAFVDAARACAFALRAENPANYLAWQITRVALWGRVTTLPPDDGTGQTMVPPPDSQRLEAAEHLLSGKNWLNAALAADDLFLAYPLCIDLQRIADEALSNLGSAFAATRASLRSETKAFIARLPGLTSLSYNDGTPFVSPATRAWLIEISKEQASGAATANGPAAATIAEARKMLADGGATEALKKLEESLGPSALGNVLIKAEALHILCAQRELKTAAALAQALVAEISGNNIDKLEPDVAAEALLAAAQALDVAGDTEAADSVREKIAALKPSAVLGWN